MTSANRVASAFPHRTNTERLHVVDARIQVIHFVQRHVSAIAAQFVEQAASSSAFLNGGDHL